MQEYARLDDFVSVFDQGIDICLPVSYILYRFAKPKLWVILIFGDPSNSIGYFRVSAETESHRSASA